MMIFEPIIILYNYVTSRQSSTFTVHDIHIFHRSVLHDRYTADDHKSSLLKLLKIKRINLFKFEGGSNVLKQNKSKNLISSAK